MNDDTSIFSANSGNCQHYVDEEIDLADLADKPFWVAWRNEYRTNKHDGTTSTTKVPYVAPGREARSNDPRTWRTLDQAADVAEKILMTNNGLGGGVGIFLGVRDCVPALRLGGIDLDCCRDPTTGEIANWARKVIKRFSSYTEISPSQKGVKIFFLYRTRDWEGRIKPLLRAAKTGRQFKRLADHDHPPGIELYFCARYFATTGDVPQGFPDRLHVVEPDDLRWLTDTYGPRFQDKNTDTDTALPVTGMPRKAGTSSATTSGAQDNSRSGRAYRWMRVFHRMGLYYPDARKRILNLIEDPDVVGWAATKGMSGGERELRRVYEAARPPAGSIDDRLADMARQIEAERVEAPSSST